MYIGMNKKELSKYVNGFELGSSPAREINDGWERALDQLKSLVSSA